ncbi:hypothetical protein Tco_0319107 [Tanacetum coccineum]
MTLMCCDDAYHVTPRVFALAGCDRLGLELLVIDPSMSTPAPRRFRWEIVYPPHGPKWFIYPKTWYRMKRTAYRRLVPVVTSPVQVKEKSLERVLDVESEEDPEEDIQEDSEEEGEPKKKRLKKAS